MKHLIHFVMLCLTGCYSVVTINLGSVSHEAGAIGQQLPAKVMCAALASPRKKLDQLQIEALHACLDSDQAKPKAANHE